MLPVFALAHAASPALAVDSAHEPDHEAFAWDWSRSHRFFLETQVQLPTVMWFAAPNNRQARVAGFQLRLVTTCDPKYNSKRSAEVFCRLDDLSLSGEVLPQEAGLLQPILTELDELLTGAVVQLVMTHEGRITNIDLEGLERRNRRMGIINENLRLVVSRAFAGLDFPVQPDDGAPQWVERDSWLMRTPSIEGSAGNSQIVHQIEGREGPFVTVVSAGKAVIVPGDGLNKFDTRMTSRTTFDVRSGRMSDRSWIAVGGPTASSWLAEGTEGYPYVQQGRLVALTGDQAWDVGESLEVSPDQRIPTAIQQRAMLGGNPN